VKNTDLIWVRPDLTLNIGGGEVETRPQEKPKRRKAAKPSVVVDEKQANYTVAEVAAMLSLSVETVRRLFKNEPGVLRIKNASGSSGRRDYTTLRIPAAVLARVRRKNSA
jgi:hypothetical protein